MSILRKILNRISMRNVVSTIALLGVLASAQRGKSAVSSVPEAFQKDAAVVENANLNRKVGKELSDSMDAVRQGLLNLQNAATAAYSRPFNTNILEDALKGKADANYLGKRHKDFEVMNHCLKAFLLNKENYSLGKESLRKLGIPLVSDRIDTAEKEVLRITDQRCAWLIGSLSNPIRRARENSENPAFIGDMASVYTVVTDSLPSVMDSLEKADLLCGKVGLTRTHRQIAKARQELMELCASLRIQWAAHDVASSETNPAGKRE